LRLGRERLADDIAAIQAVRGAVGEEVKLLVDFNQGLSLGDALHRCHALDNQGLYWFEEAEAQLIAPIPFVRSEALGSIVLRALGHGFVSDSALEGTRFEPSVPP